MGTDIYTYCVDEINGKVITISFQSGQSVGLAPSSEDGSLEAAVHWVCALAEHDQAFHNRKPSCALTQHERWRKPTGEVIIRGGVSDFDDLKVLLQGTDHGSYGTSSGGGEKAKATVDFRSVQNAQDFINLWNCKERNGETMHVYFTNVMDGPEYLDQYSRPNEDFCGFIEQVKLMETIYDCKDEEEDYWNTAATYRISVTDEAYLEHLSVGDEWYGR